MKINYGRWLGLLVALTAAQSTAFAMQWGEKADLQEFLSTQDVLINLREIEARGLNQSNLPAERDPWSDTYWADVEGSIAVPYTEGKIHRAVSYISWFSGIDAGANAWTFNRSIVMGRDELHKGILGASQEVIDSLSPAEKYDLVLGDTNFTMTNNVIKMLEVRRDMKGMLTLWSGVCHGWSMASLNLPRPKHSFQIMSPLGRMITFYPSDVKALASFLWGKSLVGNLTRLKGNRCSNQQAKTNRRGRLLDARCFDVNPAFFHLVAVNQIGVNQHGFVMNRAYRHEVQNQPLKAYSYQFYRTSDRHPRPGMSLQDAKVRARDSWDAYSEFRSKNAVSIVGVEARYIYGKETVPGHHDVDSADYDKQDDFVLRYDLELDANDNIVGGEWREFADAGAQTVFEQITYKHPDFIWLMPPNTKAFSIADNQAVSDMNWDGKTGEIPKIWREAAIKAATYTETMNYEGSTVSMPTPQPLAKVVDFLIEMSRK